MLCTESTVSSSTLSHSCPVRSGSLQSAADSDALRFCTFTVFIFSKFTGSCVFECDPGWRRRNETDQASPVCEECEHPRQIILGNVTELPLQEEAFEWKLESCDFSCRLPWQSTHRAGVEATDVPSCVLCANQDDSYLCPDGQYPAGPFCLCQSCTNL